MFLRVLSSLSFPKLLLLTLLSPLALATSLSRPCLAHGGGGGSEPPEPGEFRATPVITIEGHGGFETNLEGSPEHYALDGLFGSVMEWGLGNGGSLSIEAAVGPALVWGEAEHFYGRVHIDEHGGNDAQGGDKHAEHSEPDEHDEHESHAGDEHAEHSEHDDHDDHDEHESHESHAGDEHGEDSEHEGHGGHDDHDDHESHAGHQGHGAHDTNYKRTDVRGFLQVRYAPNDRLSLSVDWKPYYVTQDQGEDIQGLKNELGAEIVWLFGDGDLNFALGDGLEDIVDGLFLSLVHRQGWESDGTWIGNYTDPRIGIGFNLDMVNITLDAGPRFYVPGSYSSLNPRTDFAAELEIAYPIRDNTVLFAHWQPTYSSEGGSGWGVGWQHHIGTGVTLSF